MWIVFDQTKSIHQYIINADDWIHIVKILLEYQSKNGSVNTIW